MSEKDTQSTNMPWKVYAILKIAGALIAVVGSLGVAAFANWDKLNPSKTEQSPTNKPSETASSQNPQNMPTPETTYYVIAASSKDRAGLEDMPENLAGEQYYYSFPNIKICTSKTKADTHYLVLGSELSESDAKALKQQAKSNNFDPDTYILALNQIPFTRTSCQPIQPTN